MIEKVGTGSMQNRNGHDLWFRQTIVSSTHIYNFFYNFHTAVCIS